MSYQVVVSRQAESDLRGIFQYIAYELLSPENAKGQLRRLEKAINSLELMPERYKLYEKEPWKSRGLRVMPVDNYLVFYIPSILRKVVSIIRVMYGGRQIEKNLESEGQVYDDW